MTTLPPDPLVPGGIARFGERLRAGEITAEAATQAYLERVAALDKCIGAYQYVATEQALAAAQAIDRLLAVGTDLGPLMGVPVALKDIIEVEGMPTTAGSKMAAADLIGPEGGFVKTFEADGLRHPGQDQDGGVCPWRLGHQLELRLAPGTPGTPRPIG